MHFGVDPEHVKSFQSQTSLADQPDGVGFQIFVQCGYNKGTALGAEIIGIFVLVYAVFSATNPKRSTRDSHVPVLAPLPIMVHLATIPITGTGINPARSFGAAVIYNDAKVWVDQVGPFAGALEAAAYHQYILRGVGFVPVQRHQLVNDKR